MSFGDTWKRAGEPADDFDPPDGTYAVKVVDGGAFAAGDGREFAKVQLEVTVGEHEGRQFDDFMNFNNDVGARRARENLTLYGLNPDGIDALEDLDSAILELTGTTAEVGVKHSPDGRYLNVTVHRARTGASDIPDGQEAFATGDPVASGNTVGYGKDPDDDEIPF